MSEIPADWRGQLDLRAEIARIDRDRAESEKLRQESEKFIAEQRKLMREAEKFRAEEWKLWRDWRLAPWAVGITLASALLGGLIARHL